MGDVDVRAALEQVKSLVCGESIPRWADKQATTATRLRIADIIDDALAAIPADDGEAVTEEWLRSVGFIGGGLHKYGPGLWSPNHELRIHHDGSWSIELPRLSPKTRGDLRRLAAVLGITLNETKETRP